jgi:hypothetical protein
VVFIVEILSGNAIIKVIAGKEEVAHLRTGSQVMVFSKAFNPVIRTM